MRARGARCVATALGSDHSPLGRSCRYRARALERAKLKRALYQIHVESQRMHFNHLQLLKFASFKSLRNALSLQRTEDVGARPRAEARGQGWETLNR